VLQGVRRARYGDVAAPRGALIFPSSASGPLDANAVRRAWLPALAAADVRHLRIHSLRHFYASAQIVLGANIKYISTQLGHASVMITVDRYAHLFPDEHRVAARRLEAMLSSGIHPADQDVNAITRS